MTNLALQIEIKQQNDFYILVWNFYMIYGAENVNMQASALHNQSGIFNSNIASIT